MGIDLVILPQRSRNMNISADVIFLDRDYELFNIIKKLEEEEGQKVSIQNKILSYLGEPNDENTDNHFGATINNAYGDRLKSVFIEELVNVLKDFKTESYRNRAFIAYLKELPGDLKIWLYWK